MQVEDMPSVHFLDYHGVRHALLKRFGRLFMTKAWLLPELFLIIGALSYQRGRTMRVFTIMPKSMRSYYMTILNAEDGEDNTVKELPIVLKADVAGSLDALISALTSVSPDSYILR
jgi:hypothetical protein